MTFRDRLLRAVPSIVLASVFMVVGASKLRGASVSVDATAPAALTALIEGTPDALPILLGLGEVAIAGALLFRPGWRVGALGAGVATAVFTGVFAFRALVRPDVGCGCLGHGSVPLHLHGWLIVAMWMLVVAVLAGRNGPLPSRDC